MKTCFKCGIVKPLTEFYRHGTMADGLLGKCKDCTRTDVREHRAANLERYRAYDRQRALEYERIAKTAAITKAWRQKYPERSRAQVIALRAHRQSPERCEHCTEPGRVERHHPDYSLPRLIEWLCKPCHAIADRVRRAREGHHV